jgi:broad specificity phosphatase PhoE
MRIALTEVPLWAALLPVAAYLVAVGCLHLRRRPVALSGHVDVALLTLGIAGMVIAGPLALLQPGAGTSAWTTAVLLLGFAVVVAGAVLAARPRMVIYNVGLDQMRPVVASVAAGLDPTARWAGETAALPARGLQVHLDERGPARTVSVIAAGRTSAEAWAEFSRRLRRAIRTIRVRPSPWAWAFLTAGFAVALASAWLALTTR